MREAHYFVGGMRGPGGANASWPLAKLTIATHGEVVVALRGLDWLPGLRGVRYRLTEIARAEAVRGGLLGSSGIRVVGRGRPSVVFWTREPDEVLWALADHGVATSPGAPPPTVWFRP